MVATPPAAAPPRPALPPATGHPPAGRFPAGGPARLSRRLAGRPRWAPACAALVTLAVTLWKIQVPSFWRDEAATQSATQRSFTGLIAMLGHVNVVHGSYYVLMWLEVRLATVSWPCGCLRRWPWPRRRP